MTPIDRLHSITTHFTVTLALACTVSDYSVIPTVLSYTYDWIVLRVAISAGSTPGRMSNTGDRLPVQ